MSLRSGSWPPEGRAGTKWGLANDARHSRVLSVSKGQGPHSSSPFPATCGQPQAKTTLVRLLWLVLIPASTGPRLHRQLFSRLLQAGKKHNIPKPATATTTTTVCPWGSFSTNHTGTFTIRGSEVTIVRSSIPGYFWNFCLRATSLARSNGPRTT
jgi:hypothetical protein